MTFHDVLSLGGSLDDNSTQEHLMGEVDFDGLSEVTTQRLRELQRVAWIRRNPFLDLPGRSGTVYIDPSRVEAIEPTVVRTSDIEKLYTTIHMRGGSQHYVIVPPTEVFNSLSPTISLLWLAHVRQPKGIHR